MHPFGLRVIRKFIDEELMLTADEMPSANISSFLERDLVEDAVDGEDEM